MKYAIVVIIFWEPVNHETKTKYDEKKRKLVNHETKRKLTKTKNENKPKREENKMKGRETKTKSWFSTRFWNNL